MKINYSPNTHDIEFATISGDHNFTNNSISLSHLSYRATKILTHFQNVPTITGTYEFAKENLTHIWFGISNFDCQIVLSSQSNFAWVESFRDIHIYTPFLTIKNLGLEKQLIQITCKPDKKVLEIVVEEVESLEIKAAEIGLDEQSIYLTGNSRKSYSSINLRNSKFNIHVKKLNLDLDLDLHHTGGSLWIEDCNLKKISGNLLNYNPNIINSVFKGKVFDLIESNKEIEIEKLNIDQKGFLNLKFNDQKESNITLTLINSSKSFILEALGQNSFLKVIMTNDSNIIIRESNLKGIDFTCLNIEEIYLGGIELLSTSFEYLNLFNKFKQKISVDYLYIRNSTVKTIFDVSKINVIKDLDFDNNSYSFDNEYSEINCNTVYKLAKEVGNFKETQRFFGFLRTIKRKKGIFEKPEAIIDAIFELISKRNESLTRLLYFMVGTYIFFGFWYSFALRTDFNNFQYDRAMLYLETSVDINSTLISFGFSFINSLGPLSLFSSKFFVFENINLMYIITYLLQQVIFAIYWFLFILTVRKRFKMD